MFVATTVMLVAAPAIDSIWVQIIFQLCPCARAQRERQTDRQHLLYTCSLSKMTDRILRQVAVLMEVSGALFVVF